MVRVFEGLHFLFTDVMFQVLTECPGNVESRISVCPDHRNIDNIRGWMDFGSLYNMMDPKFKVSRPPEGLLLHLC